MELYKVLLADGYRVLTIDYRGFGDSGATLEAEKSMVEDARAAVGWLRDSGRMEESDRLIVWGHSMGTGVATRAVAEELKDSTVVSGLILEAPFNNFTDEVIHVITSAYYDIPTSAMAISHSDPHLLSQILANFDMQFQSDSWIEAISCPIMILHAMGDALVPISLARKLYDAAVATGHHKVEFHEFDNNYDHRESLSDNKSIRYLLYLVYIFYKIIKSYRLNEKYFQHNL